jgi:excisionase family DNA binding protein
MNTDPLLTAEEAAEYLGVSHWTVRRLIARGELRGVYLGRLLRVRSSDLEAFLSSAGTDTP